MLTDLETTYRDTGTDQLSWALGLAPMEALASLELDLTGCQPSAAAQARPPAKLELRLLGASHQVLVFSPGLALSETVACLPGGPCGLVPAASVHVPGWTYEFTASVRQVCASEFDQRVSQLRRAFSTYRTGIAGAFPGSPHALTAVIAVSDRSGVSWRTWHTYPQQGQIVATHTRLALHAPAGPDPAGKASAKGGPARP